MNITSFNNPIPDCIPIDEVEVDEDMGRIWEKCFSPCSSGETLEISSHGEGSNVSPNEEQEVTLTSTEATLLNTPSKMEEEQQKQLQHIHLTLGPPEKDKKKSKKEKDVRDETFIKVKGPKSPATSSAKWVHSHILFLKLWWQL